MRLDDILPYLRFVRFMTFNSGEGCNLSKPYDCRFFYTWSGAGRIFANGEIYAMPKHSVLIIPAGVVYHILPAETSVSYYMVNFDYVRNGDTVKEPIGPVKPESFTEALITQRVEMEDASVLNGCLYIERMPQIKANLERVMKEYAERIQYGDFYMSHIFAQIIIEIVRYKNFARGTDSERIAEEMRAYIADHFNEKTDNSSVAVHFGFSKNYAADLFCRHSGISMHQYLIQVRITRAISMLNDGTMSVSEVAAKCGFSDLYHFSKCFKAMVGCTPGQYRKMH